MASWQMAVIERSVEGLVLYVEDVLSVMDVRALRRKDNEGVLEMDERG